MRTRIDGGQMVDKTPFLFCKNAYKWLVSLLNKAIVSTCPVN